MRPVLSVTSECVPLVKTGGLADVAGALPAAMAKLGWEMRTILPGYPRVMGQLPKMKTVMEEADLIGGPVKLLYGEVKGLKLYVVDAPHLYDRPGTPYNDDQGRDYWDNPERFAALCRMAVRVAREGAAGWKPEIVHCHDWQAGLTPYYLRDDPTPTVMTIHNIAFHGLAPADRMGVLGLSGEHMNNGGFEYWGNISALKAGLNFANKLTTVSPTYASELATPEFGMGMDGVLRAREADLVGILNGIDMEVWNPATDPEIATYKAPAGKARAKKALRAEFGLPESDGPLCVLVSRLSQQKGLDLLYDALPALTDRGGQLALLGSGDPMIENAYNRLAERNPNVSVWIGYNEGLSHRMIAGGDAILVPSRFEPCGLTQLYGLRYGTVPVVALTGGLADTVIDASPMAMRAGVATGLQFAPVTAHALAQSLIKLTRLYRDRDAWTKIQKNAMKAQVGWDASAAEYAALYEGLAPGS